jgi:hypothetical protein
MQVDTDLGKLIARLRPNYLRQISHGNEHKSEPTSEALEIFFHNLQLATAGIEQTVMTGSNTLRATSWRSVTALQTYSQEGHSGFIERLATITDLTGPQ